MARQQKWKWACGGPRGPPDPILRSGLARAIVDFGGSGRRPSTTIPTGEDGGGSATPTLSRRGPRRLPQSATSGPARPGSCDKIRRTSEFCARLVWRRLTHPLDKLRVALKPTGTIAPSGPENELRGWISDIGRTLYRKTSMKLSRIESGRHQTRKPYFRP